jgi:hypothetical protein
MELNREVTKHLGKSCKRIPAINVKELYKLKPQFRIINRRNTSAFRLNFKTRHPSPHSLSPTSKSPSHDQPSRGSSLRRRPALIIQMLQTRNQLNSFNLSSRRMNPLHVTMHSSCKRCKASLTTPRNLNFSNAIYKDDHFSKQSPKAKQYKSYFTKQKQLMPFHELHLEEPIRFERLSGWDLN